MNHSNEKEKLTKSAANIQNINTKTTSSNTKFTNNSINNPKNSVSNIKSNTPYKINESNICNDFQSISTIASIVHGCEWLVGTVFRLFYLWAVLLYL
jgi:hypothetical protein